MDPLQGQQSWKGLGRSSISPPSGAGTGLLLLTSVFTAKLQHVGGREPLVVQQTVIWRLSSPGWGTFFQWTLES